MTPNMYAFLTTIACSEGTQDHPLTQWQGYDVIVYGADKKPEVFTDFTTHPFAKGRPAKLVNAKAGLYSTAAGRYQFLVKYWEFYRESLKLNDFGPVSQDRWALQLIRECNAISLVERGLFKQAVVACKSRWASFPGSGYNQHENDIDKLASIFEICGGKIA